MFFKVIIVLFVLLFFYLLLVPIVIYVNTNTNKYYISIVGLAKATIEKIENELFRIKIQFIYKKLYYYPLKSNRIKTQTNSNNKKREISASINDMKTIFKIVKTFKIKKIRVCLDTGDCILNAKMYPILALLNYKFGNCNINFENRNYLVLYMQSRPIYIIKSFINI
jgi:hypothetical protein